MKKTVTKALAGILAIAMTITVAPAPAAQAAKKVALDKKKLTITVGKSKKLKLKNNKKKVSWKIASGKKNIKLKAKKKTGVTIVAKKKGSAKVQAVIGKKKYTCKVTVKEATKTPIVTNEPDQVEQTAAPIPTSTPSPTPTVVPTLEPTATPEPTETPGDDEDGLDRVDVQTLREFIETLKSAGATVSDDILDAQYTWEDGYLIEINWSSDAEAVLSGALVFPEFRNLDTLSVAGTDITSLDVSACSMLWALDCSDCEKLADLNVLGCEELGVLDCSGTALKRLDLSGCPYLDEESVDGPDDMEIISWSADEKEVQALEELVTSLIENGASEIIMVRDEDGELNEDCYAWDAAGRLSEIYWDGCGLRGDISLTEFTNLTSVDIYENAITSLDLSGCSKLEYLDCSNQEDDNGYTLTSLNLKGCSALADLFCAGCALTELDLSDCINLDVKNTDSFEYDDGVKIITPGGELDGDDFDI